VLILDLSRSEVTVRYVQRSRGLLALTALLAGAAILASLFLLAPGNGDEGDDAVGEAFALMFERCHGDTVCLEQETANLVGTVGPLDVVLAAFASYRANPSTVPACHTYMHLLGAHLSTSVARGEAPSLGETWTECGAGLIHGAFENGPVDVADTADVRRVVDLCGNPEFSASLLRLHSCLHAVGHGIHTGVEGDLVRGEKVCMLALPEEASFSRNHPCLAGLYMVDRDERLIGVTAPDTPTGWGELLEHCTKSPRPEVCATAYFELSTRAGSTEALAYLDWCLGAGGDKTCLYLLGQGGAFRQFAGNGGEIDVATCIDAALERRLDPAPCREGAQEALAANGVPREELDVAVCRLIGATNSRDDTCS
jgi:hypothetical protein